MLIKIMAVAANSLRRRDRMSAIDKNPASVTQRIRLTVPVPTPILSARLNALFIIKASNIPLPAAKSSTIDGLTKGNNVAYMLCLDVTLLHILLIIIFLTLVDRHCSYVFHDLFLWLRVDNFTGKQESHLRTRMHM